MCLRLNTVHIVVSLAVCRVHCMLTTVATSIVAMWDMEC